MKEWIIAVMVVAVLVGAAGATTFVCVNQNGVNMGCIPLVMPATPAPTARATPTASMRPTATPTPCVP